ncbi:MAG: hypothetical protein JRI52_05965 [Deltaproteobacteria bacterium]|nr:hypothetical protein [Deltaproteobacteria bacterium]
MKKINQAWRHYMVILLLLTAIISCATIPHLNVEYRLPPKSDELKGKKVSLVFEDRRAVKDILGKGAQKDFKNFSGNISYSLARGKEKGFKIGLYTIPSLFMEVFKLRLENLGIEVVSEGEKDETAIVIVLKDLILDLINRKWVVTMDYEAGLVRDQKILARQMISGQGERLKLVGRGQADIVMGEIFTDMVNRLNVARLFQQASQ